MTGIRQRLYPQFARVAQALASQTRLELVDLLAQGPRNVDSLAGETGQSLANVSQHLQALKLAHLVTAERRGTRVYYRLASDSVVRLWLELRNVAEEQLPEVGAMARDHAASQAPLAVVGRDELARYGPGAVCLLDVRPALEFASGHLAGAISIPLEELHSRLGELPADSLIITYCRGEYCAMADEAAALLAANGFNVARLDGGWPEWLIEGRPVQREEISV